MANIWIRKVKICLGTGFVKLIVMIFNIIVHG